MSHSFTANFVHVIFSTKLRQKLIKEALREELFAYFGGVARNHEITLLATGGSTDHIHLLLVLPPTMTLATAVQKLKAISSRWVREKVRGFLWQDGFSAFSVSPSQVPVVKAYIGNQLEHHKKRDLQEELQALFIKCGVVVNDRCPDR